MAEHSVDWMVVLLVEMMVVQLADGTVVQWAVRLVVLSVDLWEKDNKLFSWLQ